MSEMFLFNLYLCFLYVYFYELCKLKQFRNITKLLRFHIWFENINAANLKEVSFI